MNAVLQARLEAAAAAMLGASIPFLIEAFADDKVTSGELIHAGFLALTGGLITLLAYLRNSPKSSEQAAAGLVKAVEREEAAVAKAVPAAPAITSAEVKEALAPVLAAPVVSITREEALAQAKKD